ncbi:MAG: hypothetical protein AAGG01_24325 [Planctomycetota bacterium]
MSLSIHPRGGRIARVCDVKKSAKDSGEYRLRFIVQIEGPSGASHELMSTRPQAVAEAAKDLRVFLRHFSDTDSESVSGDGGEA